MEWLRKIGQWIKSKTVVGAIVVVFGPMIQRYLGIESSELAELIQAIGTIIAVIGARDAVRKLEDR